MAYFLAVWCHLAYHKCTDAEDPRQEDEGEQDDNQRDDMDIDGNEAAGRRVIGPDHRLNYLFRRFSRRERDDRVQPIDIDQFVSQIQDAKFEASE